MLEDRSQDYHTPSPTADAFFRIEGQQRDYPQASDNEEHIWGSHSELKTWGSLSELKILGRDLHS